MVWGQEEKMKGSKAREGDGEGICRGALARAKVGSERGHAVTSSDSWPSTCGAQSLGSTGGQKREQQRKAAWAWKRREKDLEGAR